MRKDTQIGRLIAVLVVPMILILMSSVAYASFSNSMTVRGHGRGHGWGLEKKGIDPIITNYWVIEYCGYGFDITVSSDNLTLTFNDDLVFPGWYIKLVIELNNTGAVNVILASQLEYWDGSNWKTTDEAGLLSMFRIIYEDGFYLGPGSDSTWFTNQDIPIPLDFVLEVDEVVYKREYLFFDGQDYPELQDQEFEFRVVISFELG
ncbi:MAG: hypothetical protein OEY88_10205 [Candidatus Bathyarchaeota archaeon]|nr:hypothetical protein [Candidatus Bathyarchaeota archaeon]